MMGHWKRVGSTARRLAGCDCQAACLAMAALSLFAACSGATHHSGPPFPAGDAGPHSIQGGFSDAAAGSGENTACEKPGSTQACCNGNGTQTCNAQGEFALWGACLDLDGNRAKCDVTFSSSCKDTEFANCDAGTTPAPAPSGCHDTEFGLVCDGGVPPPGPQMKPRLCSDMTVNTEPEILVGYSPADGQSVQQDGQIKVWVTDECPAFVATNEQIDPSTGKITRAGDRTGKASDGYLNEPALYIAPDSAESGGVPHFPQYVRGAYDNMPPTPTNPVSFRGCHSGTFGQQGPAVETPPAGTNLSDRYDTEFIWDVAALGLAPGQYTAEFLIHDGDHDRAVGCVNIVVKAR